MGPKSPGPVRRGAARDPVFEVPVRTRGLRLGSVPRLTRADGSTDEPMGGATIVAQSPGPIRRGAASDPAFEVPVRTRGLRLGSVPRLTGGGGRAFA